MTLQNRYRAQAEIVAAAKSAQRKLSDEGMDLAPIDVVKIAAMFVENYAVLSCAFGDTASQQALANQLRCEFLHQVRRYEEIHMGGDMP